MKHRLATVLCEAMSEPRFAQQWLDEADTSFRPFAAPVLDLRNAKQNPHTWVDNRAPVENWKQVSVWESTFSDATPTALTWIPL